MSGPVTECAVMPLGPSIPALSARVAVMLGMLRQAAGVRRTYYAFEHETPTSLRFFVDWDNSEARDAFATSTEYAPYVRELGRLLAGPASVLLVSLSPSWPHEHGVLQSGSATEVLSLYFAPDIDAASVALCESKMRQFTADIAAACVPGFTGSTQGWADRDTVSPKGKQQSRVYVLMLGWTSIAAHQEFRGGPVMADVRRLLDEVKAVGVRETEMYHVENVDVHEVQQ